MSKQQKSYKTETAAVLYDSYGGTVDLSTLDNNILPFLVHQDVVEVTGAAGSGKTELLYHLIVCSILPFKWKDLDTKGLNSNVILVSNNDRFDVLRLSTIMEKRLETLRHSSMNRISKTEVMAFIEERIKYLHIISCLNFNQFFSALKNMQHSLKGKSYLIMIDEITAFYWTTRAAVSNQTTFMEYNNNIATSIKSLCSKHNCTVIVTRRHIFGDRNADKKALGPLWQSIVKWEIQLNFRNKDDKGTFIILLYPEMKLKKLCYITRNGLNFVHDINT